YLLPVRPVRQGVQPRKAQIKTALLLVNPVGAEFLNGFPDRSQNVDAGRAALVQDEVEERIRILRPCPTGPHRDREGILLQSLGLQRFYSPPVHRPAIIILWRHPW